LQEVLRRALSAESLVNSEAIEACPMMAMRGLWVTWSLALLRNLYYE